MTLQKLCMLGILGAAMCLILRGWKSDMVPLLRVGMVILFGVGALDAFTPLLSYLESEGFGLPASQTKTLGKALGIALLSAYTAGICRECGENAAAEGVETAGKIEILLLCLPLIQSLLAVVGELLSFGGGT